MLVSILPYTPSLASKFKDLNVAWLEKYFFVEEKDIQLLNDCKNTIINKGGFIFFAEYKHKIVGCFSFIKIDAKTYELGKMAVDPKFQGLKIGQHLLTFAIEFAKKANWDKIILYSNTKLTHALYLYRKFGFVEIALEKELPYLRSDIKMELILNT